ncbi:MAG: DNA-processing protein DprA [Rhodosalinus sp.]
MPDTRFSSTHPLLPPTTEEDRVSWLRLLRSRRVGPTTFHRLMAEHGSAEAALEALPGIAAAAGVADYRPCPEGVARAELRAGREAGAQLICRGDPHWPAALDEMADAPPLFWALGHPRLLDRPAVALVGARNASSLGTRMSRALARGLGEAGFAVVSGLARGIDAAAHHAALESGTVAVQAGGVDVPYPSENAALADEIARRGLRLSEQPIGLSPQARHFPARNRIISGLARAVVVVEAAARSGSLITARTALDQGREVLAVPGHPLDARAAGCNLLIRDGAGLVRSVEDVIEAIGPARAPAPSDQPPLPELAAPESRAADAPSRSADPRRTGERRKGAALPAPMPERRGLAETAALHGLILQRLGPSPLAEDQLIRDLDAPAARVAPVLVELELDGRIRRAPGGLLSRAD